MNTCETTLFTTEFMQFLSALDKRLFVISDTNIVKLYQSKVLSEISAVEWIAISPGEEQKNRATKEMLEDLLLERGIRRNDVLVAIGGGVISDLVGFISSTLLRGIPFINVPTTLLAMVDASIGGKTGVNTKHMKNAIGTYYSPIYIHTSIAFLKTLPQEHMLSGLAEIIKYGLIINAPLFKEVREGKQQWDQRNHECLENWISKSQEIKGQITKADLYETGYRQILNFGHTIAHAIETVHNYQIFHGFAVAIGLLIESYISFLQGLIQLEEVYELKELLIGYGFPLDLVQKEDITKLYRVMMRDKKNAEKKPHFVHIQNIGSFYVSDGVYSFPIEKAVLERAFSWYFEGGIL